MSEQEHLFCGSLAKEKQIGCLGKVFRQVLFERHSWPTRTSGCGTSRLENKESWYILHRSYCRAFGTSWRRKESQDRCDVTDCCNEELPAHKKLVGHNTICAWTWQSTKSVGGKHFLFFWDQKQEEFGDCRRYNISRKRVPLPMDLPAWKKTKWFFSQSKQSVTTMRINTSLAWASGSYRVASSDNTWRLYIQCTRCNHSSSATTSSTCVWSVTFWTFPTWVYNRK